MLFLCKGSEFSHILANIVHASTAMQISKLDNIGKSL